MRLSSQPTAIAQLAWEEFDFIDLGCSKGGSLLYCRRRFHAGRGIGLDLDEAKVSEATAAGHDAVIADATKLGLESVVSFVSMMDFLEHLPDLRAVEETIDNAARAASDFLFISHPSFEGRDMLERLGLQQYWWDWSGHLCHIEVADYCQIFDRLGLRQYAIRYIEPIHESSHPSILPVEAPRDQHAYDPAVHPPKELHEFSRPVWRMQEIFVALRPYSPDDWTAVTGLPPAKP